MYNLLLPGRRWKTDQVELLQGAHRLSGQIWTSIPANTLIQAQLDPSQLNSLKRVTTYDCLVNHIVWWHFDFQQEPAKQQHVGCIIYTYIHTTNFVQMFSHFFIDLCICLIETSKLEVTWVPFTSKRSVQQHLSYQHQSNVFHVPNYSWTDQHAQ